MNVHAEPAQSGVVNDLGVSRLPAVVVMVFVLLGVLAVFNQVKPFAPTDGMLALLVVVGSCAAVASLVPVLSWTNAGIALGLASGAGGLLEAVNAVFGLPFARREFLSGNGPVLFGLLPWWLPAVWGAVAVSARGVARLILHRRKGHPLNGLRVIGVAAVLAGATSVSLEMFATRATHLWESGAMSVTGFASVFLLHLAIQIVMTPMLIDKFPGRRPPNWLPLWVWGAVMILLAAGIIAALASR